MGNTLSDHGHVNRGVCSANNANQLEHIVETRKIEKRSDGIFAPLESGRMQKFNGNEIVSMNLWGFKPGCFGYLEQEFTSFIKKHGNNPKSELDIPTSMDVFVKKGEVTIEILMTDEKWFGVTYREDRPFVVSSLRRMIDEGLYPEKLW